MADTSRKARTRPAIGHDQADALGLTAFGAQQLYVQWNL